MGRPGGTAVTELTDAVADGRGGAVWLDGPADVDRTVAVRAAPGDEARPLAVARRLLERTLEPLDPAARDAVLAGAAAPAHALLADGPVAAGPDVVAAVAWALARRAEHAPLLCAVHDAQHADAASLRVLLRLLVWLDDLPLGLVVSAGTGATGINAQALALLRDRIVPEPPPHGPAPDGGDAGAPGGGAAEAVQATPVRDGTSAGTAPDVASLLAGAREAAALGAPECGVPALRTALKLEPPAPVRAEVLLALGAAEAAAGLREAPGRFEAAAALATGDDRARALAALAGLWTNGGRATDAAEALERAAAAATDPALRRSLRATRLSVATLDGVLRAATAAELAAVVADPPAAPTPGERGLLAMVAWERGQQGEPATEVADLAERALDGGRLLADATSEGVHPYVAAGALLLAGAYERELEVLGDALDDAAARGSLVGFAAASSCRGWPHLLDGRVADALADFELAVAAVRHGWVPYLPAALAGLAHARLEHDGPLAALDALDLDATRADWAGSPMLTLVDAAAAAALLELGDAAGALREAERADTGFDLLGWHGPGVADHRVVGARAAYALGDHDRAHAHADEALAAAERCGVPHARSAALRAVAAVAAGSEGGSRPGAAPSSPQGAAASAPPAVRAEATAARSGPQGAPTSGTRATEALEAAVAVTAGTAARLEHAHALADLGAAHLAAGRDDDARDVLRRALDAADRTGARRLATTVRTALVAAGGRPRRARLTGPASLTPAQRRVATLAAAGLSNREIAERLWVTVKAVEFQLSGAYAKLGVTRRDLPAALARP